MLLIITSRSPTEKEHKYPELLPHFWELLPPDPEKQGIGARTGLLFPSGSGGEHKNGLHLFTMEIIPAIWGRNVKPGNLRDDIFSL